MSKRWIMPWLPVLVLTAMFTVILTGCTLSETLSTDTGSSETNSQSGDLYTVTRVIDGDTIDVKSGEVTYRVRYIGVNTPESDESCYLDATEANRTLVDGQQVRLIKDVSNTDRYGRLLRFVYVGDTFVNEVLVRDGWAEAVLYPPDDQYHDEFVQLEQEATAAGRGCHPTGIFNDGSYTR